DVESIPEKVLRKIRKADILIALIAGNNANVIFEAAYRLAIERNLVLVVDSPQDLPLYLRSFGRLEWKQEEVIKRIDSIAADTLPVLSDFAVEIPQVLKADIDLNDTALQTQMRNALWEIEERY